MAGSDERRSVERMQRSERITVKVGACAERPEQVGREFQCNTVNISPDGLEFLCTDSLSPNAGLELCITVHGSPCKFYLCGRVVHSQPGESGANYLVGVSFNEKVTADLLGWRALFEE